MPSIPDGLRRSLRIRLSQKFLLAIFLLFTIYLSYPYFTNYLSWGHDLQFHLLRIEGISTAIKTGQFPVKINPVAVYGYGYASEAFYPNLFLYIPAFFHILGVSLEESYKMLMILSTFATLMITYWCVYVISKSRYAGIVGAIVYSSSLYRLNNVYERADVGETIAMIFLPLVILGLYYIFFEDPRKWWVTTIAFTCVLQSHILSFEIIVLMTIILCVVCLRRLLVDDRRLFGLLKAAGLCVLLNLWFLVPFLYFLGQGHYYVNQIGSDLYGNSEFPAQIFMNFVHLGLSELQQDGVSKEMALNLGLPLVFGAALLFVCPRRKRDRENYRKAVVFAVFGFASLLLCTCLVPWDAIQSSVVSGLFVPLQYVWRFLEFASVFLAFTTAIVIALLFRSKSERKLALIGLSVLVALSSSVMMDAYLGQDVFFTRYSTVSTQALGACEYLHVGTNLDTLKKRGVKVTSDSVVTITNLKKSGTNVSFDFTCENPTSSLSFDLPLLDYPGYVATLNGVQRLKTGTGGSFVLRVYTGNVSKGSVTVRYKGLPLFTVSYIISLLTVLMAALYLILRHKGKLPHMPWEKHAIPSTSREEKSETGEKVSV